ncbi:hypothetical protein DH2020_021033 [Rehmannia glutinosa]|uniref:AB hydrolase-1 domain-containing protein n=1 Tax=Rehmannia glutinosa TaxID=99300 RepID=A0ABR0WBH8_REHGL
MFAHIAFGLFVSFVGYAYLAIKPPSPKICGSAGGPPVTSPRVKLDNGRHLAYKERGVAKEQAKHKIIVSHAFGDSKDFNFPISEEVLKELQIYIVAFDRAGYGESDPNPRRTVKSEAFDIQELADKLQLGPKFYVIGLSIGAYAIYGCLKYIPHRSCPCGSLDSFLVALLSRQAIERSLKRAARSTTVDISGGRYTPWLVHWWMNQKWLPSLSNLVGKPDPFSRSDLEILKQLAGAPKQDQGKVIQQGVHESLHRDLMVAFGKWDFEPTDISDPFPNNDGCVHIWQGYEDKVFPFELNRYLSQQLPWFRYHEVGDAGHLLIYNETHCEAVFKALVSS